MKRVFFIFLVFVVLCSLAFSACGGQAPAPPPTPTQTPTPKPTPTTPIKIGHLRPLTGHMAILGERMIQGGQFAFEEACYEVAGRKVEVITADSGANPAMAVDAAKKLVEHDKVCLIIGPTVGGPQMAVSAYMNKVGVPLIFTNPAPAGVIFEKHQWTFLLGGTEPQVSSPMGDYTYEGLGYRTITVITGDWVPGHGFLNAFMDAFKAKGGKVIQEQYPPFDTMDFAPYITTLKDADAVVAWFDGITSIRFLSQYHDFGIRKRMPVVAAFNGGFFVPLILRELPPEAADAVVGEYCPTPYTPLLDTEINKRFLNTWGNKMTFIDDSYTGPYEGALVALAALKATGGDTAPEKLRQAILGLKLEGPQGPVRIDPATKCAIKSIYISEVVKKGDECIWNPVYTYPDVPPFGLVPPTGGPPAGK